MNLNPDIKRFISPVDRCPAIISIMLGPLVLAFWWVMSMDQVDHLRPVGEPAGTMLMTALAWIEGTVLFLLGPLAGLAAALCARRVYLGSWLYALPSLVGSVAFIVNGVFFFIIFVVYGV